MTTGEQPAIDRTLCLVSGYHPASFPPADAYESGLRHRFAVVLGTYRREKADLYFDTGLFLRLVLALCQSIGYDSVEIRLSYGGLFSSFNDFARHCADRDEADQEPPARIELGSMGQLGGIVETEFWAMVGGPWPYHDSYTFSFYTAQDRSAELRRVSEMVCWEAGAVITGCHTELQSKEPYCTWWRKALLWFAPKRNR